MSKIKITFRDLCPGMVFSHIKHNNVIMVISVMKGRVYFIEIINRKSFSKVTVDWLPLIEFLDTEDVLIHDPRKTSL